MTYFVYLLESEEGDRTKKSLCTALHPPPPSLDIMTYMNMNMEMDRNKMILIGSVSTVVILSVVFGYYYMKKSASPTTADLQTAATQGVLPSIGAASNPLTNKPDINPTSKTNPFTAVKTNPFQ